MISNVSTQLYSHETFYKAFLSDLSQADEYVLIESPFLTLKRLYELLPIFVKLRHRGIPIVINTRNPQEHDEIHMRQANEAVRSMQQLGIKVLYTVKHHRKLAVIDGQMLWEGSLNILSQSDSCEIMRRIESAALATEMLDFIEARQWF